MKRLTALLVIVSFQCAIAQSLGPARRNMKAATIVTASSNGQSSTTNWGSCGSAACAGGAGNSASLAQATGISSPSLSGSAMNLSFSSPASGNNALYYWKPGVCDTCTWVKFEFDVWPSANTANYEFDSFIFNKTNGNWDAMFGKQCNTTTGHWQYANQSSAWTDTAIACSFTPGTHYHLIFSDFYTPSDTSCTGGVPCLHFGSITINGTTTSWGGVTMPATTLDPTWSSVFGCQFQMDSSSAATITETVDNVSCTVGK